MTYRHHESGLTMVETMVTLLFVAFAVIALIRLQNYLAYDNSLARQKNDAMILAVKQVETLREFQVLNNTSGYTSYSSIASNSSSSTGTTATYTITWTVTAFTNPTYKSIGVVVSWTDRYNNAQSVRVDTIIAGNDPQNSAVVM